MCVTSLTCGDASNPIVEMRKLRLREARRYLSNVSQAICHLSREMVRYHQDTKGRERHSDGVDGGFS